MSDVLTYGAPGGGLALKELALVRKGADLASVLTTRIPHTARGYLIDLETVTAKFQYDLSHRTDSPILVGHDCEHEHAYLLTKDEQFLDLDVRTGAIVSCALWDPSGDLPITEQGEHAWLTARDIAWRRNIPDEAVRCLRHFGPKPPTVIDHFYGTDNTVTVVQPHAVTCIDRVAERAEWRVQLDCELLAVSRTGDGVCISDSESKVRLLDAASGVERWVRKLPGPAVTDVAYYWYDCGDYPRNGLQALCAAAADWIYALDLKSGDVRWRRRTSAPISAPIVMNEAFWAEFPAVFVGTTDGSFYWLHAETGAMLGRVPLPGQITRITDYRGAAVMVSTRYIE